MPRGGRGPRRLHMGGQPPRGRRRFPLLAAPRRSAATGRSRRGPRGP
jgi:hypothetical protein